jgi:hypothetical protein
MYQSSQTIRRILPEHYALTHVTPPISLVSSPHHFFSITANSLVVSLYMPMFNPFMEVVRDLCFPGGPAAFLILEVPEDGGLRCGIQQC